MFDKKAYAKQWRENNPDKIKELHRLYRLNNPDKVKEYNKQYCIKNSEKLKEHTKQWRIDNPEKAKETNRQYYTNNSEKLKECNRQWHLNNIEKVKEYYKQYHENNREKRNENCRNKRKIDLKFNLDGKISSLMRAALKGNKASRKLELLINYTLKDLEIHLQKTIPEGYTWQDYIEGKLHIDHIIPISAFNYIKSEDTDFKRCWALDNLQLLPARENLIKYNKLYRPFQSALAI